MSKVAVLVKLSAQEGKRDALVEAIRGALPKTADEPGTLVYVLHTDDTDESSVWFYELYADADARDAHNGGEVVKAMLPALGGLLGGPPQIIPVTPVDGKGIPAS